MALAPPALGKGVVSTQPASAVAPSGAPPASMTMDPESGATPESLGEPPSGAGKPRSSTWETPPQEQAAVRRRAAMAARRLRKRMLGYRRLAESDAATSPAPN